MLVTFCGHSQIPSCDAKHITAALEKEIIALIEEGADEFYLGGYGEFDSMCATVVLRAKQQFPHIISTLVIPYLDKDYDKSRYNGSVYPPLEHVPRRFAISKRNEWMIEQADVVVTYITHSWGGAATTAAYAKRKNKRMISVVPEK